MQLARTISKILPVLVLLGFIWLGLSTIQSERQLNLENDIKIETQETKLRLKQDKLQEINEQLETEQADKDELLEQIERLEADLQAKRAREAEEEQRLARAAQRASMTQTASAAPSHSGSGSCEAEIQKYDWNKTVAYNVMMAESGGRTGVINDNPATRDYSVGCFQVNLYGANARNRPSVAELQNAEINVRWAYNNYVANGKSFSANNQWGVCRSIACY